MSGPAGSATALPAQNYGWSIMTYRGEYAGEAMREDITFEKELEQPTRFWAIEIAQLAVDRGLTSSDSADRDRNNECSPLA